jgi:transcriptional regulator with XRE-family HTH domain
MQAVATERPHRRRQRNQAAYERLRLKLKEARMAANLTQVEVARLLGRPQSFVSKVETRERRVDFIELQVLARIYGKPIDFFEEPMEPIDFFR